MEIKCIDSSLMNCIKTRGKVKGKIAELSNEIFTVLADGSLIYFVKDEEYISSMAVVLKSDESFKEAGLCINDEVYIDEEKITLGRDKQEISISGAEVCGMTEKEKEVQAKGSECTLVRNLIALEDSLYKYGKHEGIAPIVFEIGEYVEPLKTYLDIEMHNNLYTSYILDKTIVFFQKLVKGDIERIWEYSCELLGLGPGVTPSSDDFLCGFMNTLVHASGFFHLDIVKVFRFNEELILSLNYDKQKISHYMLKSSVYGKTQKAVVEVIKSAYTEEEKEFKKEVKTLVNFGDITGTDMLCGIYLAYRTLQIENFREKITKNKTLA